MEICSFHGCSRSFLGTATSHKLSGASHLCCGGSWRHSKAAMTIGLPLKPRTRIPGDCRVRLGSRAGGCIACVSTEASLDENSKALLKKRAVELVDDLKGTCIYLVGMMGSGKSTIGQALAEALGYYFFDSDKVIEAADGRTVSQMLEQEDEESFRDAETEVLKQLSCMGRLVVATGGGTVLRPVNWSYLRHGVTVWLDVPVEALAKRVIDSGIDTRPLLGIEAGDSVHSQALEKLSSILKIRGPFYADSDATVSLTNVASQRGCPDVASLTPSMVAIEVLEAIDKLIRCRRK